MKLVVISVDELKSIIVSAVNGKAGKPKKSSEEDEETDFDSDDEPSFGEEGEEETEEDEVTAEMIKAKIAQLVKKKKDEQVKKAFAAIKCKPSVSQVPESKYKTLLDKLNAIK